MCCLNAKLLHRKVQRNVLNRDFVSHLLLYKQ